MTSLNDAQVWQTLSNLIADAIIAKTTPAADDLSRSEAERLFGYSTIARWTKEGKVSTHRSGAGRNSTITYSRHELDCLRAAERTPAYLVLETK